MQVRGAEEEVETKVEKVIVDDEELKYDVNEVWHLQITETEAEDNDPFLKDAEFIKGLGGVSSNRKRSTTALKKRFEGKSGVGTKRIEDETVTGYNAFGVIQPPYNLVNLGKLYDKNAYHSAAVDAKVANIVGLGYDFIESPKAKRGFDEVTDEDRLSKLRKKQNRLHDELMDRLDEMNEEDEFAETLSKVWTDYEIMGNGYIEIGRSVTGQIEFIGHIPAQTIRIRRDRDGFVQIIANKAVFFRNFGDKKTVNPIGSDQNPNELIHIKKYSPTSTYYGVPDIVSAAGAVAGHKFAEDFNLDYFVNKAVPRHVIKLYGATLNPKLAKNILEFFETSLKGRRGNHRALFIPLPGGTKDNPVKLEIEPIEAGIQDASFIKYRQDARTEILAADRVPISKIILPEGVSLASARDADKNFKENVCQPEQRIFEKKLNKIFKEWTDMFILKLKEMSLTDENTQSMIDERRIKTGQRTPNELRIRDGHSQHPDGDRLVDLNATGDAAKQRNEQMVNRERDSQRSAAATDSVGEGRNTKGEGRTNGTG